MTCNKEHRYLPSFEDLPDSQAGPGRHKCCGCAYEQGYDDAINGHVRNLKADELDYSQAGTGRHKDVQSAYNLGYSLGLKRRNNK
jgi:hypothetical protein